MNKVVLINNFGMFPTTPPYSTSCAKQLLKTHGFDVTHIDLNILVWETLLSTKFLSNCHLNNANTINSNVPFCKTITEKVFKEIKSNVLNNIDYAKNILRNIELFNDSESLSWAINIIFQAQQLIYYQYGTFIHNKLIFWPKIGFNTNYLTEVYDLSMDEIHNPLIAIYFDFIVKELISYKPDIIGIDIQFPWEIIQTLTLNKLIKKYLPGVHVNYIGYGFDEVCFSRIANKFNVNSRLMIGFDSIFLVRNDNEFVELYSLNKFNDKNLNNIKSLAFVSENKSISVNGPLYEASHDDSIFPDYGGLKLEQYYSPEITFNDKLSSKCFWNKCTFCNINKYKEKRCEVNLDSYVTRINTYIEKYGCKNLFLLDEAATPKLIDEFSQKIIDSHINITWSIRTRVDSSFDKRLLQKMYRAGCREMWIGIEAISEKVLADMQKTDKPNEYSSIVENEMNLCQEIGIGLHSCFIFGFPTETASDRLELYNFFKRNTRYIKKLPFFCTFNVFNLNTDTYIYEHYTDFNIKEILYDEANFNMINIPFIRSDTGELQEKIESEIDEFSNKLTNIFVRNDAYKLLWFTIADSSWELLIKKYCINNIFQKEPDLITKLGIKLYYKIENIPILLGIWNKFMNNKKPETSNQIYH